MVMSVYTLARGSSEHIARHTYIHTYIHTYMHAFGWQVPVSTGHPDLPESLGIGSLIQFKV